MSQTPCQVIDGLLRGGNAERVGTMEFYWSDAICKWVGQGYPTRVVRKKPGQKRWNT